MGLMLIFLNKILSYKLTPIYSTLTRYLQNYKVLSVYNPIPKLSFYISQFSSLKLLLLVILKLTALTASGCGAGSSLPTDCTARLHQRLGPCRHYLQLLPEHSDNNSLFQRLLQNFKS